MPGRWCKRFRQLARIAAFSESRCRNGRNRRLLRLQIARVGWTPCKGLGRSGKIPLPVRHGNSSDTTVRQSAIGKPAPLGEAALYLPVKRFFEKSGFDVKGEVNGCDLVAYRGDEPPVIVELKLRFTLALVLQGIDRLAISERVYLAVPRPPRTARGLSPEAPGVRRLCRRIGLGLLLVGRRSGTIAVIEEPVPYRPRRAAALAADYFGSSSRLRILRHTEAFGAAVFVVDFDRGPRHYRTLGSFGPNFGGAAAGEPQVTEQSSMDLLYPAQLVFHYERLMSLSFALCERPVSALLLGVGGAAMW